MARLSEGRCVTLVLLWANLGPLLLPAMIAITASAILAIPLRRAAERSGLPRVREPCFGCVAEGFLVRNGYCPEVCTVNSATSVGLLLFVATAATATFALLDPGDFVRRVLPFSSGSPGLSNFLLDAVVGTNAAAALLIGAYFGQDRSIDRRHWLEGSAVAALGLMTIGEALPGPALPWVDLLLPLSLGALLLGVAVEWRARHGRPAFGLRTLAVAAAPLFLLTILATIRIVQVVQTGLA
jgi:hypothetical protein